MRYDEWYSLPRLGRANAELNAESGSVTELRSSQSAEFEIPSPPNSAEHRPSCCRVRAELRPSKYRA